jgi:hypothetical protein
MLEEVGSVLEEAATRSLIHSRRKGGHCYSNHKEAASQQNKTGRSYNNAIGPLPQQYNRAAPTAI